MDYNISSIAKNIRCQKFFFERLQKLHWISNLLLQNKTVRASAPNFENSLANSGETAWAGLRHAHSFDSSFPFFTKLEPLVRIGLTVSSLPMTCFTTKLQRHKLRS